MCLNKKSFMQSESGLTVVEAAIYLPLLMLAFLAFIVVSFYVTQRVVLDSAVSKVCIEASAYLSDEPKTGAINEFTENANEKLTANPYTRMIGNIFTYGFDPVFKSTFDKKIEEKVNKYASFSFIMGRAGVKSIKVTSNYNDHFFFGELIINAEQEFTLPLNLTLFGVENVWKFNATAKSMVFKPASLINDVDFVFDAIRWVGFDIRTIRDYVEDLPNKIVELIVGGIF